MASKQANRQAITLKGSTTLVTEFFKYAVNTSLIFPTPPLVSTTDIGQKHPLPTRGIPLGRLPYGQKIWTDCLSHPRSRTGKLSG